MQTDTQVLYLGRFVSREHFCAFVYNSTGQRLVKSYDEFSSLISSGVWFAEQKDVPVANEDPNNVDKVVRIKSKRGNKCQSLQQQ
jgi:hypothetical protein